MIGGTNGIDLSKYLINFNSADWANQANAHLQSALNQALPYAEKYTQQAVNAVQDYNNQAQKNLNTGFAQAQALNAPQHLATYNALDAYQNSLGLPTPVGGSALLANNLQNQIQQQQMGGSQGGVPGTTPSVPTGTQTGGLFAAPQTSTGSQYNPTLEAYKASHGIAP